MRITITILFMLTALHSIAQSSVKKPYMLGVEGTFNLKEGFFNPGTLYQGTRQRDVKNSANLYLHVTEFPFKKNQNWGIRFGLGMFWQESLELVYSTDHQVIGKKFWKENLAYASLSVLRYFEVSKDTGKIRLYGFISGFGMAGSAYSSETYSSNPNVSYDFSIIRRQVNIDCGFGVLLRVSKNVFLSSDILVFRAEMNNDKLALLANATYDDESYFLGLKPFLNIGLNFKLSYKKRKVF